MFLVKNTVQIFQISLEFLKINRLSLKISFVVLVITTRISCASQW